MPDLKNHVPSLTLCKKLKELGFKQDKPFFYYINIGDDEWDVMYNLHRYSLSPENIIPAPLTTELLEVLPHIILEEEYAYGHTLSINCYGDFTVAYMLEGYSQYRYSCSSTSLPGALAKMWIYLKESNLLPKEEK